MSNAHQPVKLALGADFLRFFDRDHEQPVAPRELQLLAIEMLLPAGLSKT